MGHEERLSPQRLSGRCSFRKRSLATDDRVGGLFGQAPREAQAKERAELVKSLRCRPGWPFVILACSVGTRCRQAHPE